MRKRKSLALTVFGLLALGAGVTWWTLRPDPGMVPVIGPHSVPIRWVSFEEAHRRPIIDLPKLGIVWPKPLVGAYPNDNSQLVAGYLVVTTRYPPAWSRDSISEPAYRYAVIAERVLSVPYALGVQQPRILRVGPEIITVIQPENNLLRRYLPKEVRVGPWLIHARVKNSYWTGFGVEVECPPGVFAISYKSGSSGGIAGSGPLHVGADLLKNGDVKVNATIKRYGDKGLPYPLVFTIEPNSS